MICKSLANVSNRKAPKPGYSVTHGITQRKEAGPLAKIIEDFDLILNNEQEAITRPEKKNKDTIIDLTFTTTELEPLDLWAIDEDNLTTLNLSEMARILGQRPKRLEFQDKCPGISHNHRYSLACPNKITH
jgi:hypothetical protein